MKSKSKSRLHMKTKSRHRMQSKSKKFLSSRLLTEFDGNTSKHSKKQSSFVQIDSGFVDPALLLKKPVNMMSASLRTQQNDDPFPEQAKIVAADKYEQCVERQGFLAQVYAGINDQSYPQLIGKPIFAKFTPERLTIFQNQDANSILRIIDQSQFGYAMSPETWKDIHCFQILEKNIPEDVNEMILDLEIDQSATSFIIPKPMTENVLLNLCADNDTHKASWLTAFMEVNSCGKENEKKTKEIEVEINPMQQLQDEQDQMRNDSENNLQDLNDKNKQQLKNQVNKMQENIKAQEIYEAQLQKEADRKLASEKQKTADLEKQKECLDKILQIQQQQEEDAEKILETEELNKITSEKISNSENKIINQLHGLDREVQKENQRLLDSELRKQEKIKESMTNDVTNMEKNSEEPQLACTNEQLKTDADTKIREFCASMIDSQQIPDQYAVTKCLRKDKFCEICCAQSIGEMFIQKLINCNDTCNEYVLPTKGQDNFGFVMSYKTDLSAGPATLRKRF